MGNTEISYHHKDIIFKSLTEIFANRVLDFYDINTAPIVRAEPANLPTITVQEKTMDFVFYLADDSYLHLEFQSTQGPKELERFMEYDVALYRKHHKTIHTYVVYGAGIADALEVLSCGSMNYQTKGIFMDRYDGDQLFAALGLKIRSGANLDELERMQLAFLPLMKSSHSKQERAVETIELAGMILDETQKTFLTGCVIAISDNFIDREYTRKILEVLRMSKVLRALEEEAKDEGRVEGLEEGRIEEKRATAKKLLLKGMNIDEIAEITGLLKEDIRLLH
ncbi:MAG: Rpn family recombination-promoting nuclease/putative transposase [Desulfitobacteriaceae bacterium]|nr:Rpn family recombination-promoting nuclease/putative transposase [Desulfitobacteriaceae bacterium]MDI6915748.1 Rpn family recombination-promoting nuclease/putative transposase [Desulfitobacteriaceae bacterium]